MTVIIYTGILANEHGDSYGKYLYDTLEKWIVQASEIRFVILSREKLFNSANCIHVAVQVPSHPFFQLNWFNKRLPAILKEYQASCFISLAGACSKNTDVPQVITWPAASLAGSTKKMFYHKSIASYLTSASVILVPSDSIRRELVNRHGLDEKKLKVLMPRPEELYRQTSFDEANSIRDEYTGGNNYFIYDGPVCADRNIIDLLKAFSVFKKRQKSEWKFVLAGKYETGDSKFVQQLESYKYREDVVMVDTTDKDLKARLTGAAWAVVDPAAEGTPFIKVLGWIRCGVPVIINKDNLPDPSLAGNVLLANSSEPADLAEQMMLVYKDEFMRLKLIETSMQAFAGKEVDEVATLSRIIREAMAHAD